MAGIAARPCRSDHQSFRETLCSCRRWRRRRRKQPEAPSLPMPRPRGSGRLVEGQRSPRRADWNDADRAQPPVSCRSVAWPGSQGPYEREWQIQQGLAALLVDLGVELLAYSNNGLSFSGVWLCSCKTTKSHGTQLPHALPSSQCFPGAASGRLLLVHQRTLSARLEGRRPFW